MRELSGYEGVEFFFVGDNWDGWNEKQQKKWMRPDYLCDKILLMLIFFFCFSFRTYKNLKKKKQC